MCDFKTAMFSARNPQHESERDSSVLPRAHRGVLFVFDDEDAYRESIEELFEDQGYLVLAARNGSEALARMRGMTIPSVAIVDLNMPGMNGWELIEQMKQDPKLKAIPIIVLTANSKAVVDGASYVFAKPYSIEKLLQLVDTLCG